MDLIPRQKDKKADGQMEATQAEGDDNSRANRMKVMKKLEKFKLQRSLNHCCFSPANDARAVYEIKIKKLKRNNQDLAKALSDKKIEVKQWYNTVVRLETELQEAREKLLSFAQNNCNSIVTREVQKQLMELGQPLSDALSSAIENVVKGVESLTKAKQLASSLSNGANLTSRSSSSSNSLPRTSGSRVPVAPGSSNPSPQRAVLPVVSGHVLQPACVPIQKLNIAWQNKTRECSQATEDKDLDLSNIAEQLPVTALGDADSSTAQDSHADNEEASSFMEDVICNMGFSEAATTGAGGRQTRRSVRFYY